MSKEAVRSLGPLHSRRASVLSRVAWSELASPLKGTVTVAGSHGGGEGEAGRP